MPPAMPVYQDWTRELESVPAKDIVSFDVWGQGTNEEAMPAPASLGMTPDQNSEWSGIMADVQTVLDGVTVQFIRGVHPLD